MTLNIPKYIIIALAIICVMLGAFVSIQTIRITNIKSDLNITILERDSLQALSAGQSERLTKLNILLEKTESACLKRLEARKTIEQIFNNNRKTTPTLRVNAEFKAPVITAKPLDNNSIVKTEENNDVIPFEKSTASIRLINDSLRLFCNEGGI